MDERHTGGHLDHLDDATIGREMDPCRLLRRLGRRRDEDWRQFVGLYGSTVRRLVDTKARRLGLRLTGGELDELVQDLYMALLVRDGSSFRGHDERQFWQFLRRSIHHLVVDRLRHDRASKRGRGQVEVARPVTGQTVSVSDRRDPERRALHRERLADFLARCRQFTGGESRALSLVFVAGWTSREVSHALGGAMASKQIDNLVDRFRRHAARDGVVLARRHPGPELETVDDDGVRERSTSPRPVLA